jgi:hypothetical protein
MQEESVQDLVQVWLDERHALRTEYKTIVSKFPEADAVLNHVYDILGNIASLARSAPRETSSSIQWEIIVKNALEDRKNLCKALKGKNLFSALFGTYTVALNELKSIVQSTASEAGSAAGPSVVSTDTEGLGDGFREQRRRKRNPSGGSESHKKRTTAVVPDKGSALTNPQKVANKAELTKNYYAPLRTVQMDATECEEESSLQEQQQPPIKAGRPPPIVLTAATNLMQLQAHLKVLVKGKFELRATRNGTRVVTQEMADYAAVRAHLENKNLSYYTFHPKSEKPIKAVIRHLPSDTPAEDISNGLQDLGFSVISVRQMTANRQSPEGGSMKINLPLFLVTLCRNSTSPEIFKLASLCHIAIRVEAYRAQNSLTQCFNCQKFGHVWANCRQPPRCMWCGGGHLHKECPEAQNKENSIPSCCNCTLKNGEMPHPSNYRGCSHAKEELQRRKAQRSTNRNEAKRTFTSNHVVPGQSFAEAVRVNRRQPQEEQRTTAGNTEALPPTHQHTRPTGQSVQVANVNSSSLNDMFKVATVVQQIMTGLNDAVSEEEKIVAMLKLGIFRNLLINSQTGNGFKALPQT